MNEGPEPASELHHDDTSNEKDTLTEAERIEQPAEAPLLTDDQYKVARSVQPPEEHRESTDTTSFSASEVSSMIMSERSKRPSTAKFADNWDRPRAPKDTTELNQEDNIADKARKDIPSAMSKLEQPGDCGSASMPRENGEYDTAGRMDSYDDEEELAR